MDQTKTQGLIDQDIRRADCCESTQTSDDVLRDISLHML